MGLITTLLIDGIIITSALAGIRRATGWSMYHFIEPRLANPTARMATKKFLNVGEWIVDKTVDVLSKAPTKNQNPLFQKHKEKGDTVGSLKRKRGRWD